MLTKLSKVILTAILCASLLPLAGIGFAWAEEGFEDGMELSPSTDDNADGTEGAGDTEGSGDGGDTDGTGSSGGDEGSGGDEPGGTGSGDDGSSEGSAGSGGTGNTDDPDDEGSDTSGTTPSDSSSSVVPTAAPIPPYSVEYRAHVQSIGWQGWVKDGKLAGTTGRSLRMEALCIILNGEGLTGSVEYRMHVQSIGWQNWVKDGAVSGTTGQSLRAEAVSIRLTGQLAEFYDIYYRVHSQNYGWLDWTSNGKDAGTAGLSLRMEAIEICLVIKGGPAPGSVTSPFKKLAMQLQAQAHVQSIGWQGWVSEGATAGTTGRSLRVEALCLQIVNADCPGSVEYNVYCAGIGWQGWKKDGAVAGTTGQSRQVEAVQARLTGDMAAQYDVYYRVHVATIGWMDWAKNEQKTGTIGLSCRVEAIQVKLVPSGGTAPGPTTNTYLEASLTAQANVAGTGWLSAVSAGATAGTTGQSRQMEAFKITATGAGISGGIEYQACVQTDGWGTWMANGAVAGTEGQNKRIEAIKIRLTGDLATRFDVYYRTHVANFGWLGWAKNGAAAGTENFGFRMEAFQVVLVPKGASAPGSTGNSFINLYRDIDPTKPMIAITIDDGPNYLSRSFVDVLNKYGARGTFFVTGNNVNTYSADLKYAVLFGHEIGNHSWSHPDFTTLSAWGIQDQVSRTNNAIYAATGISPKLLRPPYGSRNSTVAANVGMPMIIWSIDTRDWETLSSSATARSISSARDGDIILIHQLPSSLTALDAALADLSSRGYQFVTVSELAYFKGYTLNNGSSYSSLR